MSFSRAFKSSCTDIVLYFEASRSTNESMRRCHPDKYVACKCTASASASILHRHRAHRAFTKKTSHLIGKGASQYCGNYEGCERFPSHLPDLSPVCEWEKNTAWRRLCCWPTFRILTGFSFFPRAHLDKRGLCSVRSWYLFPVLVWTCAYWPLIDHSLRSFYSRVPSFASSL